MHAHVHIVHREYVEIILSLREGDRSETNYRSLPFESAMKIVRIGCRRYAIIRNASFLDKNRCSFVFDQAITRSGTRQGKPKENNTAEIYVLVRRNAFVQLFRLQFLIFPASPAHQTTPFSHDASRWGVGVPFRLFDPSLVGRYRKRAARYERILAFVHERK